MRWPRLTSRSMLRKAQNSRYSTRRQGTNRESLSDSRKISSRDEKSLYIFPTPDNRIAIASDIVDQSPFGTVKEPATKREHANRESYKNDTIPKAQHFSQNQNSLIGHDKIRERIDHQEKA